MVRRLYQGHTQATLEAALETPCCRLANRLIACAADPLKEDLLTTLRYLS